MRKSWIAVLAGLPLVTGAALPPSLSMQRPAPQSQSADVVQVDFLGRFLEDSGMRRQKSSTRHRAPRSSQTRAPQTRQTAPQPPQTANVPVPLPKPGMTDAAAETRPADAAQNRPETARPTDNAASQQPPANAPSSEGPKRTGENQPVEKKGPGKPEPTTPKQQAIIPAPVPAENTAKSETPPATGQPAPPTVQQPATATEPAHEAEVPKPLAKPEPGASDAADGKDTAKQDDTAPGKPDETKPEGKQDEETVEKPASPPPPPIVKEDPEKLKACLADLTAIGAKFEPTDPIDEGDGCGIEHPVDVAEVLPGLSLGGATMRCETALTMAHWLKDTVQPALNIAKPGRRITGIVPGSTYACRLRNSAATGKISEHARGNAFDVAAFKFDNGEKMEMKPRNDDHTLEGAFQKTATAGACLHFMTVLAPGSDAAHETHLHLDIMDRKGGYRICE